jgi:hypothetical protein
MEFISDVDDTKIYIHKESDELINFAIFVNVSLLVTNDAKNLLTSAF